MKAVVIEEFGDVNKLELEEVKDPEPGEGEVLVRVRATSVNPIDWKIRSGAMKGYIDVKLPTILGRDLVGEVEKTGKDVTTLKKGERVMGIGSHTYAELATAKADTLARIPDQLSFEQAAALPLVVLTGAQLIERGVKIERDQTVLVLGALGSVGRSAVHVALQHGAKVIAGIRGSQLAEAQSLKAHQVVAIDDEAQLANLHDLDAVADTIDGPTAARALSVLKDGGVFGTVLGPPKGADGRNIRVVPIQVQPDAVRLLQLAEDVARGAFIIPIARTLPLDQIRKAQQEAEDGKAQGKVVLSAA